MRGRVCSLYSGRVKYFPEKGTHMEGIELPDHIELCRETDTKIVVNNHRTAERYTVGKDLARDEWGV